MKLIATFFLFVSLSTTAQDNDPVNIYQEPNGDGGFRYFAQNNDLAPYQLEVSFPELKNLKATVTLPFYTVVYPGEPQVLFELKPKTAGSTSFKSGYKLTLGDPGASVKPDVVYQLPYEHNKAYRMVQGPNGSYTHQEKYAWDFLMDEGTKICAGREGLVIQVKEDSDQGGPDISFMPHANRITILHQDGSFADYVHLKQHGALVAPGDRVIKGQVIGYSGNTGWSTKAHLHFQVYKAVKFGIQTLPVKFLVTSGVASDLVEQEVYQSIHK